jgi:hypothetical protein
MYTNQPSLAFAIVPILYLNQFPISNAYQCKGESAYVTFLFVCCKDVLKYRGLPISQSSQSSCYPLLLPSVLLINTSYKDLGVSFIS